MEESVMSFGDHLTELRTRILVSLAAVVVAFILIFFIFQGQLVAVVEYPFARAVGWLQEDIIEETELSSETKEWIEVLPWPLDGLLEWLATAARRGGDQSTQFADVTKSEILGLRLTSIKTEEVFITSLKMAFTGAIVVAVPVWLYQVWLFVAPGLRLKERRAVFPALFFGTFLFMLGALLAYFVVIPFATHFFLVYSLDKGIVPRLTFSYYVGLETMLMLVFGIAFELPLVASILTLVGVITPDLMRSKRKYGILIMAIAAATLTPPDIFTQLLLAGPLVVLYEVSVILSVYFYKRRWNLWGAYDEDEEPGDDDAAGALPEPTQGPDDGAGGADTEEEDPYSYDPEADYYHSDDADSDGDYSYEDQDYSYEEDYGYYEKPEDHYGSSEYDEAPADYDDTPDADRPDDVDRPQDVGPTEETESSGDESAEMPEKDRAETDDGYGTSEYDEPPADYDDTSEEDENGPDDDIDLDEGPDRMK